jgi:hypothetical protein
LLNLISQRCVCRIGCIKAARNAEPRFGDILRLLGLTLEI